MTTGYPYQPDDPLAARIRYSYAPFGGEAFMGAWRAARDAAKASLPKPASAPAAAAPMDMPPPGTPVETAALLEAMFAEADDGKHADTAAFDYWLTRLTGKFETTGRLHEAYDGNFRAVDKTRHVDLSLYVRFGEILCAVQAPEPEGRRINTLLKLMDVLTSLTRRLDAGQSARTARLVDEEAALIGALIARVEAAA